MPHGLVDHANTWPTPPPPPPLEFLDSVYARLLTIHLRLSPPPPHPRARPPLSLVDSVYAQVLTIHIVALAVTVIILACFLWFVSRPFLAEVGGLLWVNMGACTCLCVCAWGVDRHACGGGVIGVCECAHVHPSASLKGCVLAWRVRMCPTSPIYPSTHPPTHPPTHAPTHPPTHIARSCIPTSAHPPIPHTTNQLRKPTHPTANRQPAGPSPA